MLFLKNILVIFICVQLINGLYIKNKKLTASAEIDKNSSNSVENDSKNSAEYNVTHKNDNSTNNNHTNFIECHKPIQNDPKQLNNSNNFQLPSNSTRFSDNSTEIDVISSNSSYATINTIDNNQSKNLEYNISDASLQSNKSMNYNWTSDMSNNSSYPKPIYVICFNSSNSSYATINVTIDNDQQKYSEYNISDEFLQSNKSMNYNWTSGISDNSSFYVICFNTSNSSYATINVTIDNDQPKNLEHNISDASLQSNKSISTESPIVKPANISCNSSEILQDKIGRLNSTDPTLIFSNCTEEYNSTEITDISFATDLPTGEVKPINESIGWIRFNSTSDPLETTTKTSKKLTQLLDIIKSFFSKFF